MLALRARVSSCFSFDFPPTFRDADTTAIYFCNRVETLQGGMVMVRTVTYLTAAVVALGPMLAD